MNTPKNKYVIYTAMVGGYDNIMQPKVVDDRFDYILFSNDIKEDRVGVWQVRPIPYHNEDNTRICRYVKTHPEELLPEYDFSVWMDSNIRIVTSYVYERSLDLYTNNVLVATVWHTARQCIYDEAFEVMAYRVEYERIVINWCQRLRKENYPQNNGLGETGLMYRAHSNPKVLHLDKMWWDCINEYSKRDQLSFDYVIWKLGIVYEFFLPKTVNVLNSHDLEYIHHANESKKYISYQSEPWLIRYYRKVPTSYDEIKKVYNLIYTLPFPHFWSSFFGQLYRVKNFFKRHKRKLKKFIKRKICC